MTQQGEISLINQSLEQSNWKISTQSSKETRYRGSNINYLIILKKKKKNDTKIEYLELNCNNANADEVLNIIGSLGYKIEDKDLNIPPAYGIARDFKYDWYKFVNDKGNKATISIFTYDSGKTDVHVTYYLNSK